MLVPREAAGSARISTRASSRARWRIRNKNIQLLVIYALAGRANIDLDTVAEDHRGRATGRWECT